MKRASNDTIAGRRYLELQRQAKRTGRPTDELIQLYALECFLDRLVQCRRRCRQFPAECHGDCMAGRAGSDRRVIDVCRANNWLCSMRSGAGWRDRIRDSEIFWRAYFPFWPALAMSVGLYVAFFLYVVVIRSLVPQPRED